MTTLKKVSAIVLMSLLLFACGGDGTTGGAGDGGGTPSSSPTAYFKASNTGTEDHFGHSVFLSGDGKTLAVGARSEDSSTTGINSTPDDLSTDSGAVYLFRLNGNSWSEQAYIKGSNTGDYYWFGDDVSLSSNGNVLAAAAILENAVYVFRFDGSNWLQEAYLKRISGSFGSSVSLSGDGNTLAVGAIGDDIVQLYRFNGSNWLIEAYLKASNPGADDGFGKSVSLSSDGNTLAVGALSENSSTTGINSTPNELTADSGAAYLFRFNGGSWSEEAYIKASNPGVHYLFGSSVSLSSDGNTLGVGASYENSSTTGINSIPNESGYQVGAAYIFRFNGGSWSEEAYIKESNTEAQDFFGSFVSLSDDGNTLAVSAHTKSSVYLFSFNGISWFEKSSIKSVSDIGDFFGRSVSISGDGNSFAAGVRYEDSSTTGVNSTPDELAKDSGAVLLY